MVNLGPYDYGGSCNRCRTRGYSWIDEEGHKIRLCDEHEGIVKGNPGWYLEDKDE